MKPTRQTPRPSQKGQEYEREIRAEPVPFPRQRLGELLAERVPERERREEIVCQATEQALSQLSGKEFRTIKGYRRALLSAARQHAGALLGDLRGSDHAENVASSETPPFPYHPLFLWLRNKARHLKPETRESLAIEATNEAYVRSSDLYYCDEDHYRRGLYIIGRNFLVDRLREDSRITSLTSDLASEIADRPDSPQASEQLDRLANLDLVLHRLPLEERRLLELVGDGLDVQDIRRILHPAEPGESGDALYQRTYKAVKRALAHAQTLAGQLGEPSPQLGGSV